MKPLERNGWVEAYPLTGGAVLQQLGTFGVVREATQADIDECCSGHGFNPAAKAVQEILASK